MHLMAIVEVCGFVYKQELSTLTNDYLIEQNHVSNK